MKWVIISLTLTIALCQDTFVFPDEFDTILQRIQLQHHQLQQRLQQQQQQLQRQQEQLQKQLQHQRLAAGFSDFPGFPSFPTFPTFPKFPKYPINSLQVIPPLPISPAATFPQSPLGRKSTDTTLESHLPPQWREHVINVISKGVTKFALDMDRAIQNPNENLVFSPVSLAVTLAMVLLASGGKTFEEVAKILSLESGVDISHHSEIVHQIFGLLLQETERKHLLNPEQPESKFAFGIFLENGFPIREQFRAVSEKVYKSEVTNLDFLHRNREAQVFVNDWVNKHTNGKIENVLSEPPSPFTNVIVTSALYFAGAWDQPFSEGITQREQFFIEPDQIVFADMMTNGGEFPYYEDKQLGLKIIGFPYKGNEMTMYAVLPKTSGRAALQQMKSRLTPELIDDLISKMTNRSCIIKYPRMNLSSTLHLRNALEALGLSSLFDPRNADLSVLSPGRRGFANGPSTAPDAIFQQPSLPHFGVSYQPCYSCLFGRYRRQSRPMDREYVEYLNTHKLSDFDVDDLRNSAGISNPGLYVDEIIHRVEMTVNEKGTEAAAATSTSLDRSGGYKWFIANRPFLFFIRHDPSRIVWFWGTINQPTPFYNNM